LAFYLPFHYYGDFWGVYIRASGVVYLAQVLEERTPRACLVDSLSASWRILNDHEQFHFVVEAGASLLELNDIHSIYRKHTEDATARGKEEALCNAHSFRKGAVGKHRQFKTAIAAFMRSKGPGYRHYHQYVRKPAFTNGQRELGKNMLVVPLDGGMLSPAFVEIAKLRFRGHPDSWPGELLFSPFAVATVSRQVPRYFVLDVPVPFLRLIRPFPRAYGLQVFVHANDHPPPHFHVSMPPGRPLGRYQWPSLDPVPGDATLTGSARKNLDAYLDHHRKKIVERLRAVYLGVVS
jgi:hypothetical protein